MVNKKGGFAAPIWILITLIILLAGIEIGYSFKKTSEITYIHIENYTRNTTDALYNNFNKRAINSTEITARLIYGTAAYSTLLAKELLFLGIRLGYKSEIPFSSFLQATVWVSYFIIFLLVYKEIIILIGIIIIAAIEMYRSIKVWLSNKNGKNKRINH